MIDQAARQRIWAALVATGLVRGARIAEQLLVVPLLLSAWGAEQFGEWTALTSIASIAFIANIGIGQAGASDIVLRYASGDKQGVVRSLFTSIVLLTIAILVGCVLVLVALASFDLKDAMSLHSFTPESARLVIFIVALYTFLSFYTEPLFGVVGAVVGAGTPNLLTAIAKAIEIVAIAAAVGFSAPPVVIATITLLTVLLNVLMNLLAAFRCAPWLSLRFQNFDLSMLQRTWKSSLGYFSVIVCMTFIYLQVPRLIMFHYFGAVALASFAALVAYTRAGRMLAMLMSQAAQIEMGRAFGRGRVDQFKSMVNTLIRTTAGLSLLLLAGGLIAAPVIIPIWTSRQVSIAWGLLLVLALVALLGSVFDALFMSVAAINRVAQVALGYAASLAVGFAVGLLLLPWLGPVAVGISLLFPEAGGALAAIWTLRRIFRSVRTPAAISS